MIMSSAGVLQLIMHLLDPGAMMVGRSYTAQRLLLLVTMSSLQICGVLPNGHLKCGGKQMSAQMITHLECLRQLLQLLY